MSKFEIKSFKSVGNIVFSETRESVRSKLGNFTEFKKSKYSKNTTDNFNGIHVYYDSENKVEAVEFFLDSEVDFEGKTLSKMAFDEIKVNFSDNKIEEDYSGAIFHSYGFSVYSPNKTNIESILVFRKGYYD